jgi:hypothetical protein
MAQNRKTFVKRNWDNVACIINNIDYRETVLAMEEEVSEAIKDYRTTREDSKNENIHFLFKPSSNTVADKLERAMKKENKINLLFNVMQAHQLQSLNTTQAFDAKINEVLHPLNVFDKRDVLDGRTARILNEMYTVIGGKKDDFFPQDLKEVIKELTDKNSIGHIVLSMMHK